MMSWVNLSVRWRMGRCGLGIAASILFGSQLAYAHHPASEQSIDHSRPRTFLALDTEIAEFDLAGQEGMFWTLALRGEYAPVPYVSVGLRFPFHFLKLHDHSLQTGLGDLDLVGKLRLAHSEAHGFMLSAGLATELPTGNHDAGLGSGHVELAPFVSSMKSVGPVILHGALGINISLAGGESEHGHGHAHGPGEDEEIVFVNPHSDLELTYHAGVMGWVNDWLLLNGVVGANTVLEAGDRGETFIVLGPEVVFQVAEQWRIAVRGHIPVAGDRRFDWKIGTALILVL